MEYKYHIFSPYRVCPLGAHVDHQHGLVTGFAIDKGVDLYFDVRDTVLKTKLFGLKVRHFNNSCLLIAFTRSIHALFSM